MGGDARVRAARRQGHAKALIDLDVTEITAERDQLGKDWDRACRHIGRLEEALAVAREDRELAEVRLSEQAQTIAALNERIRIAIIECADAIAEMEELRAAVLAFFKHKIGASKREAELVRLLGVIS